VEKRQRFALLLARHVPLRKSPRHRIAQDHDQLHRRVVARDALGGRGPVQVGRRYLPQQALRRTGSESRVVRAVVDWFRYKVAVGVEEVQLLALRETQLRMLAQVLVERRRAALLRAGYDEAHLVGTWHQGCGSLVSDAQAPVDEA